MKIGRLIYLSSLAFVVGTTIYMAAADHRQPLPQEHYSLDKSKSWNDIARGLDPRMPDSEYDAMRRQYFDDVVVPRIPPGTPPLNVAATWDTFEKLTERPWVWDRRPSPGEPPFPLLALIFACIAYLFVASLWWFWRTWMRPAGLLVYEHGLAGLGNAILHGRTAELQRRSTEGLPERPGEPNDSN